PRARASSTPVSLESSSILLGATSLDRFRALSIPDGAVGVLTGRNATARRRRIRLLLVGAGKLLPVAFYRIIKTALPLPSLGKGLVVRRPRLGRVDVVLIRPLSSHCASLVQGVEAQGYTRSVP